MSLKTKIRDYFTSNPNPSIEEQIKDIKWDMFGYASEIFHSRKANEQYKENIVKLEQLQEQQEQQQFSAKKQQGLVQNGDN